MTVKSLVKCFWCEREYRITEERMRREAVIGKKVMWFCSKPACQKLRMQIVDRQAVATA